MAKESNNKSFVLRIDAATMDALELWAADEFRSINGQLQWIIADALRRSGRLKKPRAAAGATLVVTDRVAVSEARKTLDAWGLAGVDYAAEQDPQVVPAIA